MAHTKGPWEWFVNSHGPYLATPHSGHLIVMDFVRKGMAGAQPRFATWQGEERGRMGGVMVPADKMDVAKHPDATLISAAPELFAACNRTLEILDAWGPERRGDSLERLHERLTAAIAKATGAAPCTP